MMRPRTTPRNAPRNALRVALASLAGAGLVLAAPAAAATPQRAASDSAESESLAGSWLPFALLLGAAVVVALVVTDDSGEAPTSP